jgi:two-component system, chemotaxis family, CheB/CheR fusion protein
MQIQSRSTREAIAVAISRPAEVEAKRLGHAGAIAKVACQVLRPPQLSLAEQLASSYRTRDDRLAVIAHELRNSLSVVRNAAHLFGTQRPLSEVLESARLLIERQVGQMNRFIEDLLDGSRITGPESLQRQRIDLRVLLMQVIEGIELDFGRRGHRLTVHLPHYPVWVDVDPGRLEQVFSNLLMNAAKYSLDHGDISLTMEQRLEHASVRISDRGIGISPELLPCVFGLFVQADPSAPHSQAGHGIGLAVVRNLVELHGGCVTAASDGLGHGSEFTVLLPALWGSDRTRPASAVSII